MIDIMAASVEIRSSWILGAFTIARLKKQDATIKGQCGVIKSQGKTVEHIETDVERLSKGCGNNRCVWKNRI